MAFIFVPNADGSFNEGDKQTNPDTGVEYIYLDGAWRALGPKIEDEFDTLDERYVNKSGDTMTGQLTIENSRNISLKKADGSTQFEIRPNVNAADYYTNIYSYNANGMRFRVATDQNAGSYDTMIAISGETQTIGDTDYRGTSYINRVRTPTNPDHAANKWYVDQAVGDVDLSGYLPLTGGTLTGAITSDATTNKRIEFLTNDSSSNCDILRDGNLIISIQSSKIKISTPLDMNSNKITGVNDPTNSKDVATKNYVDNVTLTGDYLPLSGGTLTGTLTGQLLKSIRTGNGYALEVKPGDTSTKAFIRTDGTSRLSTLTVESPLASSAERPFEIKGRLSDGSTVSKNFFYAYANSNGTPSAINYDGKMDSDNNIINRKFVTDKVPGRFYMQSGSLYYEA